MTRNLGRSTMKRILIGLAAATALLFAASGIIGNVDHGWRHIAGGITWFGFLLFATALVITILVALVRSRFGRATTAATLLVLILAAVAQAAPKTQAVHFTLYSANVANKDAPQLVQLSGALTAVGRAFPNDDAKTTYVPVTFRLGNGTLTLHVVDPFRWTPSYATCTATTHNVGTWTIVAGTGAYRGVRGHGTFTEVGAGIGVRDSKGACRQEFALNYVVAAADGSITRS
jgi:hypothetical protein